ncbi:MAG TPA: hypothetical protein VIL71_15290 [Spirillospora sp.]
MADPRVKSGEIEPAVRVRGERNRPTVVLVHGYPDTSAMWDEVAGRALRSAYLPVLMTPKPGKAAARVLAAVFPRLLRRTRERLYVRRAPDGPGRPVRRGGRSA